MTPLAPPPPAPRPRAIAATRRRLLHLTGFGLLATAIAVAGRTAGAGTQVGARDAPLDLLDTLLAAMGERLRLQALVARAKWNSGAPIEDPPREAAVIEAAAAAAVAAGADPDIAAAFFRAQIEAGKAVQRALFDAWMEADRPPFPDVPDLAADLRPRFDALTPRLAGALAALLPHLADPEAAAAIAAALPSRAADHLAGEGIDTEAVEMVIAPLRTSWRHPDADQC